VVFLVPEEVDLLAFDEEDLLVPDEFPVERVAMS